MSFLRVTAALSACALVAGCGRSGPSQPATIEATGPPEVVSAAVQDHAEQFAEQIPTRPAGSQQEQIAATYILGHLQQAGYVARLDGVPVADLVRSTNVVANPPVSEDPDVVIAVAYDTTPAANDNGEAIGLFLELARAAASSDVGSVAFVALGAENEKGHRGAREAVGLLEERDPRPFVIVLGAISDGPPRTAGDRTADLAGTGFEAGGSPGDPLTGNAAATVAHFRQAGFESAWVAGSTDSVGAALLEWLASGAG